jgi:hypothetical protein
MLEAFSDILGGSLANYLSLSAKIGGPVQEQVRYQVQTCFVCVFIDFLLFLLLQSLAVKKAFNAQSEFLATAAKSAGECGAPFPFI